ncbi:MAG: mandelate racemase, partial [Chloroflexota bacterium]|nr:mandelate racemase [Chloroflexota bacterium]
ALKDWGGDYGRYFGESPATAGLVIETYLAPTVTGLDPAQPALLHGAMDAAIKGYPYAKGAVEMAAYDLAGRTYGVPVHRLLGGKVRGSVPITHSIGLLPIDEAVEECKIVVAEGIKTIKIKVGVDPERDVEIVRRIREAVGPATRLCVDANCGYRTPYEAVKIIRRMEPADLIYAEQPVEGIDGLAEVRRGIGVPLMADESAWNARDVLEIAERRAADIVSIYTTKPGGLYRAMQVAAVARAAGLISNVNGSVETGVGNLANLQLAAAAEPVVLSCVVPVSMPAEHRAGRIGGVYYTDDLIASPLAHVGGAVPVPTGPGMGVEIDEAKIERYRVDPT